MKSINLIINKKCESNFIYTKNLTKNLTILSLSTVFITLLINFSLYALAEKKYYKEKVLNKTVHIIKTDEINKIKIVVKRPGKNLLAFIKENKSWGGINGGFFNHSDGYPVSKVYINNNLIDNPKNNKALVSNKDLKPILSKIFNRSELRIIKVNNKKSLSIVPNNFPLKSNEQRIFSLQAGPMLLPKINLEEEGFIIKDKKGNIIRDGISSSSKAFRSALGIKNNTLFLVSVEPVNINELAKIMKKIGVDYAMALDGGSSSSIVWSENNKYRYFSALGKNLAFINSAIILE